MTDFYAKAPDDCPHCGAPKDEWSWADLRFGHCNRRSAGIKTHERAMGYREDLARFSGDPEAYVQTQRGLQKLIDKRLAEGWTRGVPTDELDRSRKVQRTDAKDVIREVMRER